MKNEKRKWDEKLIRRSYLCMTSTWTLQKLVLGDGLRGRYLHGHENQLQIMSIYVSMRPVFFNTPF